ncbi:MAG: hypothetical protein ACF8Q5_07820 [Phycisphaerales bacterium JB040]
MSGLAGPAPGTRTVGLDELPRLGPVRLAWRAIELLGLYVVLPGVLAVLMDPWDRARPALDLVRLGWLCDVEANRRLLIFPLLFATTGAIVVFLLFDRTFETRRLWNWGGMARGLARVIALWCYAVVAMLGLAYVLSHHTSVLPKEGFLRLPIGNPGLMLAITLLYPVFSAYPQEVTHRAFFFHRYRVFFRGRWAMIVANALAFMWLHALFWNWIALRPRKKTR